MKYLVSRASNRELPSGGIVVKLESWDSRVYASHEEYDRKKFEVVPWLKKGTDHQITNDGIRRRLGLVQKYYEMEIPDLIPFLMKYGECIISIQEFVEGTRLLLRIYDDYVE